MKSNTVHADQLIDANLLSLEEARAYLQQLDLSYIVEAMCAPQYPLPRWTEAEAKRCCQLYKNFLFLHKKHPDSVLVPTREIDEFWHNHILYTQQYFHDCTQIFGHYLHHTPASPTEDTAQLIDDFKLTKQFYFDEFKHPLTLERSS